MQKIIHTLCYPILLAISIALVALSFCYLAPLPDVDTDESFLPKPEYVRFLSIGENVTASSLFWIKGLISLGDSYLTGREYAYLGSIGELSTSLDSLFYTPYYFIGGMIAIQSKDTIDYSVMRRATRIFPNDWRLALYFAVRLANGPYHQNAEAADVMRPFANSTDTTMPSYVRTIYRTFELSSMQTELAIRLIVEDCTNPAYNGFRGNLKARAKRVLGYQSLQRGENIDKIDAIIDALAEKKLNINVAYRELLNLKKTAPTENGSTS